MTRYDAAGGGCSEICTPTPPAASPTCKKGSKEMTDSPQAPALSAATVPLHNLELSSQKPLIAATRRVCPNCNKTRAFFCYDCLTPLMEGIPYIPQLPINIHIVMHGETNAQATGTHAAVLAPIELFRHNDGTSHHRRQAADKLQLPDWDPATTAVLYPEGPDTPVVGLWGQLEVPGKQQQHMQQEYQMGLVQEENNSKESLVSHSQCVFCQSQDQPFQVKQQCKDQNRDRQVQQVEQRRGQQVTACLQHFGQLHLDPEERHHQQQQTGESHRCCSCCCNDTSCSCPCHSPSHAGSLTAGLVTGVESSRCVADSFPYKTVVVLEGNWAKARTLLRHPKIAVLPRVQLPLNVRSLFWRRGTGSFRAAVDCGVCTIEAIYLLLRQLQPEPAHKWDDLLWFFSYQRQLVQQKGSHQTRQEMQQNYDVACGVGKVVSAS